jgi:NAD(P)-dependent dehydrogenase (short-subunit alcohol dehydrogenase family)
MSARVALVTGSSQGIGRAIATRLASDGLSVALNDLPRQNDALNALRDELAAKYPQQNFIVVAADVTSEESVAQMFSDTVEKLGGLDVVRCPPQLALWLY